MSQLVTYNALMGYELEKARKQMGLEQSEVSAKTGISQPVLSRLEKGKASITIDQLYVICNALRIRPEVIITAVSVAVDTFAAEGNVKVTTTKRISSDDTNTTGAMLTGAAIGSILTLLLNRGNK
ncbi:MAG: transcriptional regulator with XRE-family HTH domain [Phenylobacterium sp.]|jgi:transcriptional regulator with XRE-family HTH domain